MDAKQKELADIEAKKWENRKWVDAWSDGNHHQKDGTIIYKPDNQIVKGVNLYAQAKQ